MYRVILVTNSGNPLTAPSLEVAKEVGVPTRDWEQLPEAVLPHLRALPALIVMKFPEQALSCVHYGVPSANFLRKLKEEYDHLNQSR